MRSSNELIIDAVSAGGSFNGTILIPASQVLSVSMQAVVSSSAGTPTGTLKLQFSNDQPANGLPTNWSDITSASIAVADDGVYAIQKTEVCAQWIRAVYTRTSGAGTITARLKSMAL